MLKLTKVCPRCDTEKTSKDFYRVPSRKDNLDSHCKVCKSELNKAYRESNPEKTKLRWKEWSSNNKERLLNSKKEYRDTNKEQVRLSQKKYRENNKHKVLSKNAKRRADKLERTPDWLTKEHLEEIENFYWLAKDLEQINGEPYHVDHIVPLKGVNVSGLHVPWNLQVLPAEHNLKKGNSFG